MTIYTLISTVDGNVEIVRSFRSAKDAVDYMASAMARSGAYNSESIETVREALTEFRFYTDDCGWEVDIHKNTLVGAKK